MSPAEAVLLFGGPVLALGWFLEDARQRLWHRLRGSK